jgi:hypothetical protein
MTAENWKTDPKPGDRISYSHVGQWFQRGTLVRMERGTRGGNCVVRWDRFPFDSEDLLTNLIAWRTEDQSCRS